MTSRSEWLVARVINEGYCCVNAYLRLCKARGESVEAMAKNIGMSPDTIWYHYRKIKNGDLTAPKCRRFSDCMNSVIKEIEDEKNPGTNPGEGPP